MLIAAERIQIGDLIRIASERTQPDGSVKRIGPEVEGVVEATPDRYGTTTIGFVIQGRFIASYQAKEPVELVKKGHAMIEILEERRAVVFNQGRWYPLYRMSPRWRWDVCNASPISSEVKWCQSREEAVAFVSQYMR